MAYSKISGTFLSADQKTSCSYYVYTPKQNPKAIVQICHGMCEYVERYEPLASYLTDRGYIFCGADHLGHGNLTDAQDYGYFGDADCDDLVKSQDLFKQLMRKKYRSLPYILIGHSMGSFIARQYVVDYKDGVDALVICGTSGGDQPVGAGIILTSFLSKIRGKKYRSKLLWESALKSFNKHFAHENNRHSWISRDSTIREDYNNDSRCNFVFTVSGFNIILRLLKRVSSVEWAGEVPKGMPIYIISGDEDPIGNYGEGVKLVYDRLNEAEICNLKMKLYQGARHELFNEINREEVYEDLLSWLDETVDGVREARIQNHTSFGGSI